MAACVVVMDWVSGLSAGERISAPIAQLIVPVFAGASTYLLLNSGLIAVVVTIETRSRIAMVWRKHVGWLALDCYGGTSLALLVVTSARDLGLAGLLASLPLMLALYAAYRSSFRRAEDTVQHLQRLNQLHLATVEGLAMAIDAKDQVTHGHVKRVRERALQLACAMGVRDEPLLKALEAGAVLHDVGKLAVPDHILNKPGPLTPGEYEQLKRHTVVGADILSAVDFPYPVVPIVRHHHENWDGAGYPDRIGGEAIPLGARILAVIDCYDALTSDRPYRRAMTHEQALAILQARRGTMYDPAVVDAFAALRPGLRPQAAGAVRPARRPSPCRAPSARANAAAGATCRRGGPRAAGSAWPGRWPHHVAPDAVLGAHRAPSPARDAPPRWWRCSCPTAPTSRCGRRICSGAGAESFGAPPAADWAGVSAAGSPRTARPLPTPIRPWSSGAPPRPPTCPPARSACRSCSTTSWPAS